VLSDKCTAYGHLARLASAKGPVGGRTKDPELLTQALVFKSQRIRLLQERIRKGLIDYRTVYVISCFLCNEVYGQDFAAAKPHASMLAQHFQNGETKVYCDLLQGVSFHDSQTAIATLTRPSFDVERCVSELFAKHFMPLLEALPDSMSLRAMEHDLDESIEDGN
jgi:hypothetical protein